MRSTPLFTLATVGGFAALIMSGALMTSPAVQAIDDEHSNSDTARIDIGLRAAPVSLTYDHGDRKLVGLGSYIVNVITECNGCHSAGPATEYATATIRISRPLRHLRRPTRRRIWAAGEVSDNSGPSCRRPFHLRSSRAT